MNITLPPTIIYKMYILTVFTSKHNFSPVLYVTLSIVFPTHFGFLGFQTVINTYNKLDVRCAFDSDCFLWPPVVSIFTPLQWGRSAQTVRNCEITISEHNAYCASPWRRVKRLFKIGLSIPVSVNFLSSPSSHLSAHFPVYIRRQHI